MRDILFRGKTESGKWVYGSLILAKDYCCILEKEDAVHPMDWPYLDGFMGTFDGKATPVIPETVGEFTGFYDRNKVPIFEDDIVETPRWIVTYNNGLNEGHGMNVGWFIQRDDFESWTELSYDSAGRGVLGNIHDNPELLVR